jgi:hypothetical protein
VYALQCCLSPPPPSAPSSTAPFRAAPCGFHPVPHPQPPFPFPFRVNPSPGRLALLLALNFLVSRLSVRALHPALSALYNKMNILISSITTFVEGKVSFSVLARVSMNVVKGPTGLINFKIKVSNLRMNTRINEL